MSFPIRWVRDRFPALADQDSVLLDNAAGAQVPDHVLLNVVEAMTSFNVNKGGAYPASRKVTDMLEQVRTQTSEFINAPGPAGVRFGPNATSLITLLATSFGDLLAPGDEVVVTGLDHHANVDPWRALTRRGVVVKRWEPVAPTMHLELSDLASLVGPRTRVVAMTGASNALGTLAPIAAAAEQVHEAGAWLMVDAVHLAPHRLPDVEALAADMLVFSPYKVFGPHLGVLYLSEQLRERLPGYPLSFMAPTSGGAWEIGTQNHEAIAGFGGTFDYLADLAAELAPDETGRPALHTVYQAIERHEHTLLVRLLEGLDAVGAERYGLPGAQGRTATVSFNHPELSPQQVATELGKRGVAVAAGHYYAFDLMMMDLGLEARGGAVRASLLHYNQAEDVDRLLEALAAL